MDTLWAGGAILKRMSIDMGTKVASCLEGAVRISWEVVEVHDGSAVAAVLHRVSDEGFAHLGCIS